jgi:hypothetical protein
LISGITGTSDIGTELQRDPHTMFRREKRIMKKFFKWGLLGVGLLVVLGIIGSALGGSDKATTGNAGTGDTAQPTAASKLGTKVTADVQKSVFASGDSEALSKVQFTHYWCRWNDGEVEVHTVIKNPMAAHITVHLQPNYRLASAGLHGDGVGSQQDIGVDANATRTWSNRLGDVTGVSGTPKITECGPEINSIDLG